MQEPLKAEQAVVEDQGGQIALDAGKALRVGFATPHGVLTLTRVTGGDCLEILLLRDGKPPQSLARARRGTDETVAKLWLWLVAKNVPPPSIECAGGCGAQARQREQKTIERLPPLGWTHDCCPACAPWHKRLRRWLKRTWARVAGKP